MIVGYAQVSTDGQSLDSQHAALVNAGYEKVFAEKQSGAKTDRAQLAKAIAATRRWRHSDRVQARPPSKINQGLAQYPGCYCRRWRKLQVTW